MWAYNLLVNKLATAQATEGLLILKLGPRDPNHDICMHEYLLVPSIFESFICHRCI